MAGEITDVLLRILADITDPQAKIDLLRETLESLNNIPTSKEWQTFFDSIIQQVDTLQTKLDNGDLEAFNERLSKTAPQVAQVAAAFPPLVEGVSAASAAADVAEASFERLGVFLESVIAAIEQTSPELAALIGELYEFALAAKEASDPRVQAQFANLSVQAAGLATRMQLGAVSAIDFQAQLARIADSALRLAPALGDAGGALSRYQSAQIAVSLEQQKAAEITRAHSEAIAENSARSAQAQVIIKAHSAALAEDAARTAAAAASNVEAAAATGVHSEKLSFMGVNLDRIIGRLIIYRIAVEALKEITKEGTEEILTSNEALELSADRYNALHKALDDLSSGKFIAFLEDLFHQTNEYLVGLLELNPVLAEFNEHIGEGKPVLESLALAIENNAGELTLFGVALTAGLPGLLVYAKHLEDAATAAQKAAISQESLTIAVNRELDAADAHTRSIEKDISVIQKKIDVMFAEGRATDAARDALIADIEAIEKSLPKHSALRDMLDELKRSLGTATEKEVEWAKAVGTETPKQIDEAIQSLRGYVSQFPDLQHVSRETADRIEKDIQRQYKAIESLPPAEQAAFAVRKQYLVDLESVIEHQTTVYAKNSEEIQKIEHDLEDKEKKSINAREQAFEHLAATVNKATDSMVKGFEKERDAQLKAEATAAGKTAATDQSSLDKLQKEKDLLDQKGLKTVDDLNRQLALEKEIEAAKAKSADSAGAAEDAQNTANAAKHLNELTLSVQKATDSIIGSSGFTKAYATLNAEQRAGIQSTIEYYQNLARMTSGEPVQIAKDFASGLKDSLAQIFKSSSKEGAEFAAALKEDTTGLVDYKAKLDAVGKSADDLGATKKAFSVQSKDSAASVKDETTALIDHTASLDAQRAALDAGTQAFTDNSNATVILTKDSQAQAEALKQAGTQIILDEDGTKRIVQVTRDRSAAVKDSTAATIDATDQSSKYATSEEAVAAGAVAAAQAAQGAAAGVQGVVKAQIEATAGAKDETKAQEDLGVVGVKTADTLAKMYKAAVDGGEAAIRVQDRLTQSARATLAVYQALEQCIARIEGSSAGAGGGVGTGDAGSAGSTAGGDAGIQ